MTKMHFVNKIGWGKPQLTLLRPFDFKGDGIGYITKEDSLKYVRGGGPRRFSQPMTTHTRAHTHMSASSPYGAAAAQPTSAYTHSLTATPSTSTYASSAYGGATSAAATQPVMQSQYYGAAAATQQAAQAAATQGGTAAPGYSTGYGGYSYTTAAQQPQQYTTTTTQNPYQQPSHYAPNGSSWG